MKKLIAIYSIILGCSVLILWMTILLIEGMPEGKWQQVFHLTSEGIMALACLFSGFSSLRGSPLSDPCLIGSHAMVIYSVLNAAGYYAQNADPAMALLFVVLCFLSVLIIVFIFWQIKKVKNALKLRPDWYEMPE